MPKTPWADRYRAAPTNKSNVMRTIILEGPISRAALAKRVGLSLPSVMTITENLINRGLVRAVGKGKSSGGKPPELLSVVPESEYYMGVDIGRGTIRLVLMNLAQKVVYGTMVETGRSSLLKHLWTGCASGFRAVCWNPELHWIGWPEWGWRCPASSSGIPGIFSSPRTLAGAIFRFRAGFRAYCPTPCWSKTPIGHWHWRRVAGAGMAERAAPIPFYVSTLDTVSVQL